MGGIDLAAIVPAGDALVAARAQMAVTLGFHIVLACLGVAFPAFSLAVEWLGRRRGDQALIVVAQRWSKVIAVTFAVGAVSGTVLSFELGLLWPGLMGRYGAVIGVPFAVEGIAFFLEAIFIAIYLYGWDRLSPRVHLLTAVPVVVAGVLGVTAVVSANAWMNEPTGFSTGADGAVATVSPLDVILNAATGYQVLHMFIAAYMVTGFLVASVYAVRVLRDRADHVARVAFLVTFTVAAVAAPLQIVVGDIAARAVIEQQPAKFAAMELITTTGSRQPETIGGVLVDGQARYGLQIPLVASLLSGFSPDTVIIGLNDIPADQRPPATVVHLAWNAMVGAGTFLFALAAWFVLTWWRRRDLPGRWFLRLTALSGLAAILALEAGWVVTEVGRQPWIVYGILRTADAVTGAPGLPIVAVLVTLLYLALTAALLLIVRLMVRRWRTGEVAEEDVPYGPRPPLEREP
jgi:cytochrome bd ubiquinol oxidase subunit I